MKLEGDHRFDAPVQDVWDALFDPAVLAAALPGCEKLERVDGQFVGDIKIKVGPVSGNFSGKVDLKDVDEPKHYTMVIDGRGAAGFVKATASVALTADGDATVLRYDADAQVGGKIASVGQRLIDASSRAITQQALQGLHENVKLRYAARVAAAEAAKAAEAASAPPPAPAPEPILHRVTQGDMAAAVTKEVGKAMWPWFIGIAVVIALIVWLTLR